MTSKQESLKDVVTIYFSKDRPMQLDLALVTNQEKSDDWEAQEEFVIYKASDNRFEKSYKDVSREHMSVSFVKETDFKTDLLKCLHNKKYVLFIVDDCIFTQPYSLISICDELGKDQSVLGFSLRLGRNTKYCYPLGIENDIPYLNDVNGEYRMGVYDWTKAGEGDFSYPLELSSSVYPLENILPLLTECKYNTPNSLEWIMSQNLNLFELIPNLMCYKSSVAFCNPINKVQKENNNRCGSNPEYSVESLLEKYEEGLRIYNLPFSGVLSNGCHQEMNIDFIKENF